MKKEWTSHKPPRRQEYTTRLLRPSTKFTYATTESAKRQIAIGSRRTSILPSRFSRLDKSFSKITIYPNNHHKTIKSATSLNSSSQKQIMHEELRRHALPQRTSIPSQWWNRLKSQRISTRILSRDKAQRQAACTKILTTTICWISQRIQIRKNVSKVVNFLIWP